MHALHAVALATSWNEPAAQLEHVEALAEALKVPGEQPVAVALPTEQKVPAGHGRHCATLVRTVNEGSLRVPAGQGSSAAAPAPQ